MEQITKINHLRKRASFFAETIQLNKMPKDIWPYAIDFDLLAKSCGFPKEFKPIIKNNAYGGTKIVETSMLGFYRALWEWLEYKTVYEADIFKFGLLKFFEYNAQFEEKDNKTKIKISVGVLGFTFLPFISKAISQFLAKKICLKVAAHYKDIEQFLNEKEKGKVKFSILTKIPDHSFKNKIDTLCLEWMNYTTNEEIPWKLAEYIYLNPAFKLTRMKPFEIAHHLKLDKRELLEFFMLATKGGYFNMAWSILCPNCKGPTYTQPTLSQLVKETHCEVCNIRYDLDLAKNVELIFSPTKKVRPVESKIFCFTTPYKTRHFVAQYLVDPFEIREVEVSLTPGVYLFRYLDSKKDILFSISNDQSNNSITLELINNKIHNQQIILNPKFKMKLVNKLKHSERINIVNLEKFEHAATADIVCSMQSFRDLFGMDALRPDIELGVTSLTFLFTDIKDSTMLYSVLGDNTGFSIVKTHFDSLAVIVKKNNGGIVKTMGDAIMAVFEIPSDGVKAAIDIQKFFSDFTLKNSKHLILKMGLHTGPCLLVNANDKVDYFGSTVNIASRINELSNGDDIVLSNTLFNDKDVHSLIKKYQLPYQNFNVNLKGVFEEQNIYRISTSADNNAKIGEDLSTID